MPRRQAPTWARSTRSRTVRRGPPPTLATTTYYWPCPACARHRARPCARLIRFSRRTKHRLTPTLPSSMLRSARILPTNEYRLRLEMSLKIVAIALPRIERTTQVQQTPDRSANISRWKFNGCPINRNLTHISTAFRQRACRAPSQRGATRVTLILTLPSWAINHLTCRTAKRLKHSSLLCLRFNHARIIWKVLSRKRPFRKLQLQLLITRGCSRTVIRLAMVGPAAPSWSCRTMIQYKWASSVSKEYFHFFNRGSGAA